MRLVGLLVSAALALGTTLSIPAGEAIASPVSFADAAGLHVSKAEQIDPRQYELTFETAAIGRPVKARILLPHDYQSTSRRYPVLYLYAGSGGKAPDWVNDGHADRLTAELPLITVMPDIGSSGLVWFSNWHDTTTAWGQAQWETFYIDQLIGWVDANLRTRAARDSRAVVGLSQGGHGSMIAATRHPELFVAAAALSGAVNIAYDPVFVAAGHSFVNLTELGGSVLPGTVFGDPLTNEINWQAHDPTTLAPNLRGMDVWLYTGNGTPGPLDPLPVVDPVEVIAYQQTLTMAQRAAKLGVPVNLVDYGGGTHTWPYWERDLLDFLPRMMADFARRSPRPATISYDSTDRQWKQWGWKVAFERPATQEFSRLAKANRRGFVLNGTGRATVVTPQFYRPGRRLTVTIKTPAGTTEKVVRAGARGRLRLAVNLGPDPDAGPVLPGVPHIPAPQGIVTIRR